LLRLIFKVSYCSKPVSYPLRMDRTVRGVTTYGTETRVEDSSISRLSFYLKCCTVGCGLAVNIDSILIDYNNATRLPGQLQRAIIALAATELSPERLLNRVYFLDNGHTLLPAYASNAFFAIETASHFFSVEQVLISGQLFQVHKVMLCTTEWLEEYCFKPLRELQEASRSQNSTLSGALHLSFHCSHCRGTADFCTCESGCPIINGSSQCQAVHKGIPCAACVGVVNDIRGHRFCCRICDDINLCVACYDGGQHDHAHAFDIFERHGSTPVVIAPRVESFVASHLTESENEIPTAEVVPINECKACDENESTSNFWPGQMVRLLGLSTANMNGKEAMVASVTADRIFVRLLEAGETETYSVRPENLLVLAQRRSGHGANTDPLELT
jgi:hypothetical protein